MKTIIASLAAAAALAFLVALPASGQDPAEFGNGVGWFHTECTASNRANDDPIVFPRGPGQSHSHDFIGAKVDAFSTNATIRRKPTNCVRNVDFADTDRSGYWVPTLYVDDVAVPIQGNVTAGYSAGVRQASQIVPFPADFRVIAGSAKGLLINSSQQNVYDWGCKNGTVDPGDATAFPTCTAPGLQLILKFPDCWDGVNSDSSNHISHVGYSAQRAAGTNQRVCPSQYPVLIPQLQLTIRYDTTAGSSTRLASGNKKTTHGDFLNGWDVDKQRGLVDRCLRADKYCGGTDTAVPGHAGN